MNQQIVELKNISYSAPSVNIINGISAEVLRGETIFIAGKSGCGKSTLLKIMAALTYPSEGDVVIRGQSLKKATNDQLRDIHELNGFVFQDCALISNMSIFENFALPLRYNNLCPENEIKERIEDLLEELSLIQDKNNRPNQLSLGEQRLAAIGRTIITDPDLLFLDEPLVSLDSNHIKKIINILFKFKSTNKTIVIISHRTRLMKETGTKLWLIEEGKLAINGLIEEKETLTMAIEKHIIDPY